MAESLSGDQVQRRAEAGEWIPAFLKVLGICANVRVACQSAGVSRQVAYDWKSKDPDFAKQWEDALEDAVDLLEYKAWKRADTTSDTLMIFLLKAHRPAKYRESTRHEHAGPGGGPISIRTDVVTIIDYGEDEDG